MSNSPYDPAFPAASSDATESSHGEGGQTDSDGGPVDPSTTWDDPGTPGTDPAPEGRKPLSGISRTQIGRYKLVKILGKGGCGVVWHAEQTEPIWREVALKIIKPGMSSAEIIARFEAERQTLALMVHPNIATVYDAGTTESGWPYFVMELVKGVPITKYCDEHKLGIRARIELFMPVCQAVQHAHEKGVLHRDLKPSNILVTEVDGRPMPKVIDFGIAKALGSSQFPMLDPDQGLTHPGFAVGTPLYMSPEQADCAPNVDEKSDVYTLGVILHELLTGQTPISREQMQWVTLDEALQLICSGETRLPSSRLQPVTETVRKQASERASNPRKLLAALRGDLDWILLRALEKERECRYGSAAALVRDLQRYLHGEPVEAGPSSAAYRLRKFVVRHSTVVFSAAAVVLALAAGLAIASLMYVREKAARERVVAAERERNRLSQEIALLKHGVDEYRQTEAKIREQQPGQNPSEVQEKTYRALAQKLGTKAVALREKLPRIARQLEKAPEATTLQRANASYVAGDIAQAERLALAAADEAQKANPPRPSEAIQAYELAGWSADNGVQYAAAKEHFEKAEKLTDKARNFAEWVRVEHGLAWVSYEQGEYAEVERTMRWVLTHCEQTLGPDHPDTLRARHYHARALSADGQYQAAAAEYREVIPLRARVLGPEHIDTLRSRMNLAVCLDVLGHHAEAEAEYRALLAIEKRTLGPEHSDTLLTQSNLAAALQEQGKYPEAETQCLAVLTAQVKLLGEDHPYTLRTRANLADMLFMEGKLPEAEAEQRVVLAAQEKVLGSVHPDTLKSRMSLINTLYARRKYAEAEAKYRTLLSLQEQVLPPEHPDTLLTRMNLSAALFAQGKYAEAETERRSVLASREEVLGPEHPDVLVSRMELANTLFAQHKYEEAETDYRSVLTAQEKLLGDENRDTLMSAYNLACCLQARKEMAEALPLALRAVETARQKFGADDPDTKRYEKLWRELQPAK